MHDSLRITADESRGQVLGIVLTEDDRGDGGSTARSPSPTGSNSIFGR
jgi:hypothetical protein